MQQSWALWRHTGSTVISILIVVGIGLAACNRSTDEPARSPSVAEEPIYTPPATDQATEPGYNETSEPAPADMVRTTYGKTVTGENYAIAVTELKPTDRGYGAENAFESNVKIKAVRAVSLSELNFTYEAPDGKTVSLTMEVSVYELQQGQYTEGTIYIIDAPGLKLGGKTYVSVGYGSTPAVEWS